MHHSHREQPDHRLRGRKEHGALRGLRGQSVWRTASWEERSKALSHGGEFASR